MIETKLSLTIVLPGRTMFSKEECLKTTRKVKVLKNGKKIFKKETAEDPEKVIVHTIRVDGKKKEKPEVIHYTTRKFKPAKQIINISRDAYEGMVNDVPKKYWDRKSYWLSLPVKVRVEFNVNELAKSLGGIVDSYVIFED